MSLTEYILGWFEHRRALKRAREVDRAEQARRAIIRAKTIRRQKHRAFRHLDGDLRNQTCRSLAASCGKEWA